MAKKVKKAQELWVVRDDKEYVLLYEEKPSCYEITDYYTGGKRKELAEIALLEMCYGEFSRVSGVKLRKFQMVQLKLNFVGKAVRVPLSKEEC